VISGLQKVRNLIAQDAVEDALRELQALTEHCDARLSEEVIALRGRLQRCRKRERQGLDSPEQIQRNLAGIAAAALGILSDIEHLGVNEEILTGDARVAGGERVVPLRHARTVFISYSHRDTAVANRLKARLESHGIRVTIDSSALPAGSSIHSFIEASIRATDLTISIVSEQSLRSGWVALETFTTFAAEQSCGGTRFIAGYLDESFFVPTFRLEATQRIDARIEEIDALIPRYLEKKLDTVDLNNERTRLLRLRNGLGEVLERLKGTLSLDLRNDQFETSVGKIVQVLCAGPPADSNTRLG
jgi:hypothetical protein